ncbi:ABC-type transporter, integral membrane subunit [Halorubrum californiense DSM 19288]|uniref:ABC-type transporter, integral membrane subunit n=1 Tax=Halorubrum californiense DSM 19288 TaxID=1227465 RepID=M0EFM6_9EURY|nr:MULTISPECIES: metal ABC transporter permease [Halorubrum]ELZ45697.1 ABC-type transporter, integral membrane subunit [Halorubrum californiense DSM 19288]TKX72258.1 metal ABC transporter permease [Halorubrum sp. GN11GM_10-3_MGM]
MSDPLTVALVTWLLAAVDGSAAVALQGGLAGVGEVVFGALLWLLDQWYWLMDWVYYVTGVEMLNPRYRYMHRAVLVGLCVGVMAPLIGTFLVHRQLALIGDALAHTAFAGVAVGLFLNAVIDLGVSPYLTAVVVAMIAALFIELISETTDAYNDVSMAIVLSTGFALGTTLISLNAGGLAVGVNQFLFGNLSTVSPQSAAILIVLFAVIVGTVAVTRNELLYVTFDETAAEVSGIPVNWYNRVMVMLTAMVVVGAMQIMGVILVAAMLVVPVAGATQVSRSFTESLVVSVVLAELAVLLGIGVAYYGGVTAGGVIVLVAVGIYICAVGIGKLQSARGEAETPEMGTIETDGVEVDAGTGGD